MPNILQTLADQFLLFVLVLARISGLFMTMPVFGSQMIPMQIRALTAMTIALLITPCFWGQTIPDAGNLLGLSVSIGRELIIGLSLGIAITILFSGLQLAGQMIAQISGLSLADVYSPGQESNVPVFAQILDLTALAIFVIIGGHRQVLQALLDTFREIPPGKADFAPSVLDALVVVLQSSFLCGIRASAPVTVSLLLAALVVGLMSRTLPQLNSINLGFSFNSLILLITFAASISSAVYVFQDETKSVVDLMRTALLESPENSDLKIQISDLKSE